MNADIGIHRQSSFANSHIDRCHGTSSLNPPPRCRSDKRVAHHDRRCEHSKSSVSARAGMAYLDIALHQKCNGLGRHGGAIATRLPVQVVRVGTAVRAVCAQITSHLQIANHTRKCHAQLAAFDMPKRPCAFALQSLDCASGWESRA